MSMNQKDSNSSNSNSGSGSGSGGAPVTHTHTAMGRVILQAMPQLILEGEVMGAGTKSVCFCHVSMSACQHVSMSPSFQMIRVYIKHGQE